MFPRLNSARSRSLIRQAADLYLSSLVAIRADVYLLSMAENLAAEVLSFGTMPDVAERLAVDIPEHILLLLVIAARQHVTLHVNHTSAP